MCVMSAPSLIAGLHYTRNLVVSRLLLSLVEIYMTLALGLADPLLEGGRRQW